MGGRGAPEATRMLLVALVGVVVAAAAVLCPVAAGNLGKQATALVAIKAALRDPGNVLWDWDLKSGNDPCHWSMVTCRNGQITELSMTNKNLSGTLSRSVGELRSLRYLLLSQNAISGRIPDTVGRMKLLEVLDLSNNNISGSIPSTLGNLANLQYLKLNNNSLSGPIPESLATDARMLFSLDVSFNNLSGHRPNFRIWNVFFEGNPFLTDTGSESIAAPVGPNDGKEGCSVSNSGHFEFHFDLQVMSKSIFILLLCIAIGVLLVAVVAGAVLFWRKRRHEQVFAVSDVSVQHDLERCLGHLKQYKFEEMRRATNNFSQTNILGEGGYGIVYKGDLPDGTTIAVKRLKNHVVGDDQFNIEVEVTSWAVHRNLLDLIGFCIANNERLLVYPYMPNGNVASKLKECINGEPALDWPRRKRIALGASQGLLYLHEQCDPKIIHCDIKAENVLLDEYLEAVVADFGSAKFIDHGMSHVFTVVRGTPGRIPPEYIKSGHASEKTDVFCFGLLLMELVTGQDKLKLYENEYEKGILELAKDLLEQNQLNMFVDPKLRSNYDSAELQEMVQIALLCTMYRPYHRPKMSEIVKMLEGGDGVAEKWEAMKSIQEPNPVRSSEFVPIGIHYDDDQSNSIEQQASELSEPR